MSNPILVHGKRQSLGKTIWKHRASYLLMAPYFILFFFFTVLPVLMAIGVSFTDWNMLEKPEFVGWQNYVKLLLDDEIFIISLKNTLIFAVITGPVSYMLCLLFAWIINEFNRGMRTLLTLIFYAPSICGNAYMVWNLILTGDRYGYLNGILLNLDIINEPILWMKTEQYVMPNVKPAWLTLAIFQFQQMWGNTGSLFLRDEQLKPMQYALQQITAGGVSRAGAAAAVTFIIMAVPVLFFLLCQSSILETMTTSGMKD